MSTLLASYQITPQTHLEIAQGDLTQETVDAIVNAANQHLAHGGGIARAIVRSGGPAIQSESDAWVRQHGPVQHSEPAYTGAGNLPARYVIHAVGPVWDSAQAAAHDRNLADAIQGSLARADELELSSIAFPAISTGIFGFPKQRAAGIFFDAIRAYFADHPDSRLVLVRITLWDSETAQIFLAASQSKA